MGIRGLPSFMAKHFAHLMKPVPTDLVALKAQLLAAPGAACREPTVTIDVAPFMYRNTYAMSHREEYIQRFLAQDAAFSAAGIRCIWVFDGKTLAAKGEVIEERARKRQREREGLASEMQETKARIEKIEARLAVSFAGSKGPPKSQSALGNLEFKLLQGELSSAKQQLSALVSKDVVVTKAHYWCLKTAFAAHGVKYLVADFEAETGCSWLAKRWNCPVVSEDYDVLALGAPMMLRNFGGLHGKPASMLTLSELLQLLGLTAEQFTDACVLAGSDFAPNLPRVGISKTISLVRKFGSLESAFERYHRLKYDSADSANAALLRFRRARKILSTDNFPFTRMLVARSILTSLRLLVHSYDNFVRRKESLRLLRPDPPLGAV
eukprot:gnl/Hemi2/22650_TR7559_c0_g1_i1.p1 gnl/Hemi2/22650_TR7559_c0_g1~~gnl/Hemi2/22650_TR7559_c0_g1_i1.p1  ORF type:complete len:404 (-),score=75.36 gnl/Hemi2/22650_TR7559_c0_g1_i1:339-1478(-)